MTLTITLDRPAREAQGIKQPGRAMRAVRAALGMAKDVAIAAVTPHKASLRRLADMPFSVAGFAGIDFSSFHVNHGVGWLVLGASLFVIEHLIADDGRQQ